MFRRIFTLTVITALLFPATGIAEEKLDARIVANVVMLGAFSRITGLVSPENLKKAICDTIASKFIELNTVAFNEGYNQAADLV